MTRTNCKYCYGGQEQEAAKFTAHDGILDVERNTLYLDGPGAQERLSQVCDGHVYCAGLTPAVRHPATGKWVAGKKIRVGGRDENDHPFYDWLHVPIGMSPAEAAGIEFPGCVVGYMGDDWELDNVPLSLGELFPYGTENILGTGLENVAQL